MLQESLSSSDAEIVDDIQSISKDIPINQPYNENAQKVNSQNISYEPKTPVLILQTTDNDNEGMFFFVNCSCHDFIINNN